VVGNIHDVLAELIVLPGSWGVLNHGDDSLVLLIVDRMKVDSHGPHLIPLTLADQPWDHDFLVVSADEVHQAGRVVLGVHDTQVSVDALMGALKVHTHLEQVDELSPVSELFIEGVEIF
jgi:hypothetical protein